jgi:hypothetical protein
MAARKSQDDDNLIDSLFAIAKLLPWWMDLPIAAGSWWWLSGLAERKAPSTESTPGLTPAQTVSDSLIYAVALYGQYLLPGIFVIGAIISFASSQRRRQLRAETTATSPKQSRTNRRRSSGEAPERLSSQQPQPYEVPSSDVALSPSCPRCGSGMVRRVAHRGPTPGEVFWGCAQFPKCRATMSMPPSNGE